MDEGLSQAVREVFVRLYEKGLIYRGQRIIHWCPRCQTALSDEEAVTTEGGENGHLWHIRYPAEDGGGHGVVVATTRPETMLGDTGVAVNPDDAALHATCIGKRVILPLMDRPIPIVADALVDPAFGTGAVKVTPAHDANDFEMGQRHGLAPLVHHGRPTGASTTTAARYAGLDRFEARKRIVADLEAQGLLVKTEPYRVPVRRCERCDTVIEPYLSKQWFVKHGAAGGAGDRGGAQRPAATCPRSAGPASTCTGWRTSATGASAASSGGATASRSGTATTAASTRWRATDPTAVQSLRQRRDPQDPDVLDTWFSSWLWPFSTMGWPEDTPTLRRFYPTDTLITAADIIFFWVARMVMAGYEFMGECPFTRRLLQQHRARRAGAEDVEVARQLARPARRHRQVRRRRACASPSSRWRRRARTCATRSRRPSSAATSPTRSGTRRASC